MGNQYQIQLRFNTQPDSNIYFHEQTINLEMKNNQVYSLNLPIFVEYKNLIVTLIQNKIAIQTLSLPFNPENQYELKFEDLTVKMEIKQSLNTKIYVQYIQHIQLPKSQQDLNNVIYRQVTQKNYSCQSKINQNQMISMKSIESSEIQYFVEICDFKIQLGHQHINNGNYVLQSECQYNLYGFQLQIIDFLLFLQKQEKYDLIQKIVQDLNQQDLNQQISKYIFKKHGIQLDNIEKYNQMSNEIQNLSFTQKLLVEITQQQNINKQLLIDRISEQLQENRKIACQIQVSGQECFIMISKKEITNIQNEDQLCQYVSLNNGDFDSFYDDNYQHQEFQILYSTKYGSLLTLMEDYNPYTQLYIYKIKNFDVQQILTMKFKDFINNKQFKKDDIKFKIIKSSWANKQITDSEQLQTKDTILDLSLNLSQLQEQSHEQQLKTYKNLIEQQKQILSKQQIQMSNLTKSQIVLQANQITEQECQQLNHIFNLQLNQSNFNEKMNKISTQDLAQMCSKLMQMEGDLKQEDYILMQQVTKNEQILKQLQDQLLQIMDQ